MPEPRLVRPEPRLGPRRQSPTPEQSAKKATSRRPSPPGQPEHAIVNLRLVLPRAMVERLVARAIRESVRLEAVVEEVLGQHP
jgi:hypothetical protein